MNAFKPVVNEFSDEAFEVFEAFLQSRDVAKKSDELQCPITVERNQIYARSEDGLACISNFTIRIVRENVEVHEEEMDEDLKTVSSWDVELNVRGERYSWRLHTEDLGDFFWIKKATKGRGRLEDSINAKRSFANYLNFLILEGKYIERKLYRTSGWKRTGNHSWFYVTRDGVIGYPQARVYSKSPYGLEVKINRMGLEAFKEFWSMRNIVAQNIRNGIFLQHYALLSTMTSIFQELGSPVNFVTALIGKTNTLKTSCGRVFSRIFTGSGNAEINFSSTKIAIMEELGKYADSLVLVDDITPKRDTFSEREQNDKVELLIRAYGDRVPRKRSSYGSAKGQAIMPITGCCLLTGEHLEGVRSSLSRIVQLEFSEGDVDKELLSKYQRETWVLSTFVYDFISFVTDNMQDIFCILQNILEQYRNKKYTVEFLPRHREILAMMRGITEIFYIYAIHENFLDASAAREHVENDFAKIYSIMVENEQTVKEEAPAVMIVKAIIQAIKEKSLQAYTLDAAILAEENPQIVLTDAAYLRILPDQAWRCAKEYCAAHGLYFPYTNGKAIAKLLDIDSFIYVSDEGGKRRRTHKVSSKNAFLQQRFLWIRSEKVKEVEEMESNL